MIVKVLYFAQARDRAGRPEEPIEIADGARLEDALSVIQRQRPELTPLWAHLAIAVDGVLAPRGAALRDGAEIALLPPVSGG